MELGFSSLVLTREESQAPGNGKNTGNLQVLPMHSACNILVDLNSFEAMVSWMVCCLLLVKLIAGKNKGRL